MRSTGRGDWEPVAALCDRVLADMHGVARHVTTRIRAEIGDYVAVPLEEHVSDVREQQSRMLRAIGAGRGPDPEDLSRARLLGRRRAAAGVPVHSVIGAYHVGNRELWELLQADPRAAASALPEVAALMWESVHATSTALAAAHSDVTRTLHTEQVTLRHRLVELVLSGLADADEGQEVAAALGLDPRAGFVAACLAESRVGAGTVEGLQRWLDGGPTVAVVARHHGVVIALTQRVAPAELARLLAGRVEGLHAGIGLRRDGLAGASLSVADARRSLRLTNLTRPLSLFDEDWLGATLLDALGQLGPLLGSAPTTATANPHLADAVRAFATQGFSVSAAAKSLNVHANTAAYRLSRWRELTGWDVRRLEDLMLSMLSIWVAGEPN